MRETETVTGRVIRKLNAVRLIPRARAEVALEVFKFMRERARVPARVRDDLDYCAGWCRQVVQSESPRDVLDLWADELVSGDVSINGDLMDWTAWTLNSWLRGVRAAYWLVRRSRARQNVERVIDRVLLDRRVEELVALARRDRAAAIRGLLTEPHVLSRLSARDPMAREIMATDHPDAPAVALDRLQTIGVV